MAVLRAVSPFHVEYLKNMGVGASLVTSIVVRGELWGLVACHHRHAFIPAHEIKSGCTQLTQALSDQIEKIQELEAVWLSNLMAMLFGKKCKLS